MPDAGWFARPKFIEARHWRAFLLGNQLLKALKQFNTQKAQAKRRGIGWELTFKQWMDWWGDDYAKRGCHADQLSMQRIADQGPYALWNIRKGYPRDNGRTASIARRNREQAALDAEHKTLVDDRRYGADAGITEAISQWGGYHRTASWIN